MTTLLLILSIFAGDVDGCASAEKQSRYVAGYDHLVHVTNTCDFAITCKVKTTVNPEWIEGTLAPKAKHTFVTFKGSPAYEFDYTLSCTRASGS